MREVQAIFQGDRMIQDFGMTLVDAPDENAKVSVVGHPAVFVAFTFIPLLMRR